MALIRQPVVAGHFYPEHPESLRSQVEDFLDQGSAPKPAIGLVSPHAGYLYSGGVAGAVFSRVKIPSKAIILCPNHTGAGAWAAINTEGAWQTPLGNLEIAHDLATRLKQLDPEIQEDTQAHAREHALEVQLPFLQVLCQDLEFVPLCLAHFSFAECQKLGAALAQLLQESEEEILLIASSDMNHYESQERTLEKDQRAIDCILEMNPEKLYRRVHEESITMCGIIPVTCMLIAALERGATQATLIQHSTSGDVSGDYSGVVGYAGVVVE